MMFWVWVLSALTAMMAVLTAYDSAVFANPNMPSQALSVFASACLILTLIGCLFLRKKLFFGANVSLKTKPAVWLVQALLLGILFVLNVGFFGYRAFESYSHFEALRPKQTLQITATAEILELSDSVYNPALESPFRQKAVLKNMRLPNGDRVESLPDTLVVLLSAKAHKPTKVRPSDPFADLADLKVGEEIGLRVRLVPFKKQHTGFDNYRWLATRQVLANAEIVEIDKDSIKPISSSGIKSFRLQMERWRQSYRDAFFAQKAHSIPQSRAVNLSLLTGDRAFIDRETRALYQYGGVSHLLAISGAHVLFLAVLMANGVVFVANCYPTVYRRIARWQLRVVVMVGVAFLYALLTGFEVPAVRTVWMLVAFGLGRYLLLGLSSLKLVVLTALVMAYLDPLVLWQAGFWLSFVAVMILVLYENKKPQATLFAKFKAFIALQGVIFMAMLPLSLLIFDKVSLLGLLVNLFAIGLFGFVIVPINLLAGVLYPVLPSLAQPLWWLSESLLSAFSTFLAVMRLWAGEHWLVLPMTAALVVLSGIGFVVLMGKVLPRRFAVVPILASVFALAGQAPIKHQVVLETLTINPKYSATLVRTDGASWLVLSGVGADNDEKIAELLLPFVQKRTDVLTGVIVQNNNETLAKAAGRLSLSMPVHRLWWAGGQARFGKLDAERCQADKRTEFAGGQIQILTGWALDDKISTCAVRIWHEAPMRVDLGAQPSDFEYTDVIIDHSEDEKLWGMYRLLCKESITPKVFLTHSQSLTSPSDLAQFGKPWVAYSNRENDTGVRLKTLNSP